MGKRKGGIYERVGIASATDTCACALRTMRHDGMGKERQKSACSEV